MPLLLLFSEKVLANFFLVRDLDRPRMVIMAVTMLQRGISDWGEVPSETGRIGGRLHWRGARGEVEPCPTSDPAVWTAGETWKFRRKGFKREERGRCVYGNPSKVTNTRREEEEEEDVEHSLSA